MTSSCILRRPAVAADAADELSGTERDALRRAGGALVARLSGDDGPAQFGRFVLVGGLSSLLYALLFVAFDGMGDLPANVIGSIASSALANEMHRRLTFRADGRVTWFTAQWEGGGLAVLGMLATSVALAWVDAFSDIGVVWELTLVAAVTGGIGLVRFLALRWLFVARA